MTTHHFRAQSGATLMVALMMLLILTLVGLAAVRATTQQQRMAANSQFQSAAFQSADGAIRKVMSEVRGQVAAPAYVPAGTNLLVNAITAPQLRCDPDPSAAPTECAADATTGMTRSATVTYTGQFASPGFSMGTGSGSLVAHRFRIDASGQTGTTGAASLQEQGLERVGPGA